MAANSTRLNGYTAKSITLQTALAIVVRILAHLKCLESKNIPCHLQPHSCLTSSEDHCNVWLKATVIMFRSGYTSICCFQTLHILTADICLMLQHIQYSPLESRCGLLQVTMIHKCLGVGIKCQAYCLRLIRQMMHVMYICKVCM